MPLSTNCAHPFKGETIGYIARAASASQKGISFRGNFTLLPLFVRSLFALLAPTLMATMMYMQLVCIVTLYDGDGAQHHSLVPDGVVRERICVGK